MFLPCFRSLAGNKMAPLLGYTSFPGWNPLSPGDCVLKVEIKFLNPQRSVRLEKVSYGPILVSCK